MESFNFVCDSDLHFQSNGPRQEKADNINLILDRKPDIVIIAGDITNNGSDGKKILCIPISGKEPQLQGYISNYVSPVENKGIKVYACMGNHDNWTYFPYIYMAIKEYIISKYGNIRYTFIHKGVQFICLGIYPDADALKYFTSVVDKTVPMVIFFHYNLIGDWSDWWTDAEKEAFKNTISGYNIKLIVTGHIHENNTYSWNGYQVITCGGKGIYLCSFSNGNINVKLITN